MNQRTFDGPTLEVVLSQVYDELGPAVPIVSAEKVRTGGFAGFFARERYEVTVELDDHAARAPRPAEAATTDRKSVV